MKSSAFDRFTPPLTNCNKNNKLFVNRFKSRNKFFPSKLFVAVLCSLGLISYSTTSNAVGWAEEESTSLSGNIAASVYFKEGFGIITQGSTVTGEVAGGYASDDTTYGNALFSYADVNGGTLYGGYVDGDGDALDNYVLLAGGTVNGIVYGGYVSGTGSTNGNAVIVAGDADLTNAEIWGGSNGQAVTNNQLWFGIKNDDGSYQSWDRGDGALTIGTLSNIGTIKFNSVVWGKTISITDWNVVDQVAKIDASTVNFTGVDSLSSGESYTMLQANMTYNTEADSVELTSTQSNFTIGTTLEGTGTVELAKTDDSISVKYTVDGASTKAQSQTHTAAMGVSAATTALTQGAETTSNAAFNLAHSGAEGVQAFSSVGGGTARVETGSHVTLNSLNFSVGFGNNIRNDYGLLSIGGAFEAGWGKFKNHFDAGAADPFIKKSGHVNYYGLALLTNQAFDNLWHVNGAFRFGRVESRQSNALYDASTQNKYDVNIGAYYTGLELGGGKIFKIDDANNVDVYAKYYFLYQDSDKFNAGGVYKLESVQSHRLRVASRYTHDFNPSTSIYGGLGLEHEFDGKARIKVDGVSGEPSETKGTRVFGEIGVKITPESNKGLNFDFAIRGLYGDKYRGVWGAAEVKYNF